ncbi:MAG TPA: sigma-70 family RNA polymerase sigma factor [Candidatus Sulfotelmatobacter sp.]|nr:sigma-70 family RNA polymerase sigma factor [Candidatus Sulfotelmatobacter sp.]
MNEKADARLLNDFAVRRDEAAFHELVTRHADLVYSAALRQLESPAMAADVAQTVFSDLAQKSASLAGKIGMDSSLAGWLHRATRYAALNHLRDERRRRDHERQAMEQLLIDSEPSADWPQIAPVLDEALDSLEDDDREALLLRYFKNQDFRAVGFALGVSDDTAQKRVSRAVEKLREFFTRKKITIGAGSLGILISANAVQSAPVGLAATISTAALAGTAVTTSTLIAATAKTIAMTTLQKTLITATLAVVAGAGVYEDRQAARLNEQNQALQQQEAPLTEQIQKLQNDFADATNRLAGLLAENARLQSNSNQTELLKLRGEVGVLRQNAATMQTLQEQNQKLRTQPKGVSAKPPEVPPQDLFPRDSWTAAGYDDPRAAFQTAILAITKGDLKGYAASLSPDLLQARQKQVGDTMELTGKTLDELTAATVQEYSQVTGYRILDQQSPADDEVVFRVYLDGVGAEKLIRMKKIGAEWKVDAAP